MSQHKTPPPCKACQDEQALDFDFSMAFQPIIDLRTRQVFAYEALVRGTDQSGAAGILARVNQYNRYRFDQSCRIKAVELAAKLQIPCYVSINFLPNAVYQAATCLRATLAAAKRVKFPTDRLLFEVTEQEQLVDMQHLKNICLEYRRQGFKTAIDDFGAGYSGLNLLAEFQPDLIKLDMALMRNIDQDPVRQAIVHGMIGICRALKIEMIAEGIESQAELDWLQSQGISLFQGYLFAKPGFEHLPEVCWPTPA